MSTSAGSTVAPSYGKWWLPADRRGESTLPPTVLFVEGSIGVGKSTLLQQLQEAFSAEVGVGLIVFVPEPVGDWQRAGLLSAMYEGALSLAVFQMAVLATRSRALSAAIRAPGAKLVVAERSLFTDRVFAEVNLRGIEYAAYLLAWQSIIESLPEHRSAFLMLELSPDKLLDRIAARNRDSESGISLDYLHLLQGAHDRFYEELPADVPKQRIVCSDKATFAARDHAVLRVHDLL